MTFPIYDPFDWYWIVGGDDVQVYSSARAAFVPVGDEAYQAWLDGVRLPTRIDKMGNLIEVLRGVNVPPYHTVSKRVMVDRLNAAGKLDAARAALDSQDLYTRERWNNRDSVYADDPTTIAVLIAIGADPAAILAS